MFPPVRRGRNGLPLRWLSSCREIPALTFPKCGSRRRRESFSQASRLGVACKTEDPARISPAQKAATVRTLDKNLEDLLTRVDEFVGMLDMIRNDSSQIVNESVPHIHAKAMEMRQLYRKIDKLEAFVKMVGNSVTGMEERITKAESDLGTFPNTFKKLLHTINVPSFLNKSSSSRPNQTLYEPPDLFKTEDYFPSLRETQYM
ncbi:biogenesis of lysosome-related organelles complex 1 subunit 4 isoform X2 [Eublepharis macularius]|uniref:Biogenesis of lysosome-related organelles complex 1 subunit 4 isoform X2 n=1 Tax=Eublepharis macularius TaxID=481883 RepID=A0AA97JLF2_EUBMA|nr:biogenesis of lysosome-related organelles complex 1 subunit 4 isoform X2 [Eublepharis macularius]